MAQPIRIDFLADVTCPWSLIGLQALLKALDTVGGDIEPRFFLQPFELNEDLGPEGANAADYAIMKYRATQEEVDLGRQQVKAQAAQYGFTINQGPQTRIWNTRDAHRLLFWTGIEGKSLPLLLAFYRAYLTEQRSLADHAVLLDAVKSAGLDVNAAKAVLTSGRYDVDVAEKEKSARLNGVVRVPTAFFERLWAVEGAQTPQVYITMIRDILSGKLKSEGG